MTEGDEVIGGLGNGYFCSGWGLLNSVWIYEPDLGLIEALYRELGFAGVFQCFIYVTDASLHIHV